MLGGFTWQKDLEDGGSLNSAADVFHSQAYFTHNLDILSCAPKFALCRSSSISTATNIQIL